MLSDDIHWIDRKIMAAEAQITAQLATIAVKHARHEDTTFSEAVLRAMQENLACWYAYRRAILGTRDRAREDRPVP